MKYAAKVKDGLLEISSDINMKALIDEKDVLIVGGKEYKRIEKSVEYKFVQFNDCSFGDAIHITFEDLNEDFGANHKSNQYGDYQLCITDKEGNMKPNPEYVGKEFIVRWDMKKVKVADPFNPGKNSRINKPRIVYLKLND